MQEYRYKIIERLPNDPDTERVIRYTVTRHAAVQIALRMAADAIIRMVSRQYVVRRIDSGGGAVHGVS